jgi:hypothetical protein
VLRPDQVDNSAGRAVTEENRCQPGRGRGRELIEARAQMVQNVFLLDDRQLRPPCVLPRASIRKVV